MKRKSVLACLAFAILAVFAERVSATPFTQINLASSVPGLAANTDPLLINPWGLSFAAASPFWVANQGTATTVLLNPFGVRQNVAGGTFVASRAA